MGGYGGPKQLHVAILNVPPIAAQVDGDPLGSGHLGDERRRDRLGLTCLPGLANRRDVVDVDG